MFIRSKIDSIQALRGFAALGVVLFHFREVDQKYASPIAFLPRWLIGGATGVDLFFVISGFVMVLVTRRRFGRASEVGRFAWYRATRVYPVYWVYFLLTLLAFLIRPGWVNADQGHQANDLLASFLLFPVDHLPFVQVAWSLIHEVWFYIVFSGLLFFPERYLSLMLLIWAAVIGVANGVTDVNGLHPGMRIALHPFTIEFLLGACMAQLADSRLAGKLPAACLWGVLGSAVLVGLPVAVVHAQLLQDSDVIRAAILGPVYAGVVVSTVLLERMGRLAIPGFLHALGDRSYTLYLSHVLVIGTVGHFWGAMRGPHVDSMGDWLLWPLMMSAVLIYAWLGYRFIERPLIDLSHQLWSRFSARSGERVATTAGNPVSGSGY